MFHTRQTLQRSALLAIGLLALTGSSALALDYVFSDLGTITGPLAGTQSVPQYINNQGQVVISATNHYLYSAGTYTRYQSLPGGKEVQVGNVNDLGHTAGWIYLGEEVDATIPVRYDGAIPTPLQVLGGGTQAYAQSINNHDQLVGNAVSNDHGTIRPVRWDGTAVTDLGTLGGTSGTANDINDAGAIVGESHTPNDASLHATHWNGSTITDLGSLGGYSAAFGINEAGQIVGYSYVNVDNSGVSAVKWLSAADAPIDLPSLPGTYEDMAIQLNNVGQVVGYSVVDVVDGVEVTATLWDGDQVIDLNDFLPPELATAGWRLTSAADINDHGVIVGIAQKGWTHDGVAGFQLTPVPVPAAVWLFGSGLAGLVGVMRRPQSKA